MWIFPAREHQVMQLMMHAACHHTDETEGMQLWLIGRWDKNSHRGAVIGRERLVAPASHAIHRRGMCESHSADRIADRARSAYDEPDAAFDRLIVDVRRERDVVHVYQVLAERLDVHLAPIRLRIGLKNLNDLLDRRERDLAGLSRAGLRCHGCLRMHHHVLVHHGQLLILRCRARL